MAFQFLNLAIVMSYSRLSARTIKLLPTKSTNILPILVTGFGIVGLTLISKLGAMSVESKFLKTASAIN
jgi:hypothetical protein